MRIAIVSEDGASISPYLRRSRRFLVLEVAVGLPLDSRNGMHRPRLR